MQIRPEIAAKHWLSAAIEETAKTYAAQGYEVTRDAPLGDMKADLVVRKGNELIVMEFKLGNWSAQRSNTVRRLRNEVVHRLGGRFNLVVVTPPQEKAIEIAGIEAILSQVLRDYGAKPDWLSILMQVENVSDVTLTAVTIDQNQLHVQGTGVAWVKLQQDVNADGGNSEVATLRDSFPFDFTIILDKDLHVIEVEQLEIESLSYVE